MSSGAPAARTLDRGLGPWASASIVVGTIIGTGVFLKTAVMAQLGGSPRTWRYRISEPMRSQRKWPRS